MGERGSASVEYAMITLGVVLGCVGLWALRAAAIALFVAQTTSVQHGG